MNRTIQSDFFQNTTKTSYLKSFHWIKPAGATYHKDQYYLSGTLGC